MRRSRDGTGAVLHVLATAPAPGELCLAPGGRPIRAVHRCNPADDVEAEPLPLGADGTFRIDVPVAGLAGVSVR